MDLSSKQRNNFSVFLVAILFVSSFVCLCFIFRHFTLQWTWFYFNFPLYLCTWCSTTFEIVILILKSWLTQTRTRTQAHAYISNDFFLIFIEIFPGCPCFTWQTCASFFSHIFVHFLSIWFWKEKKNSSLNIIWAHNISIQFTPIRMEKNRLFLFGNIAQHQHTFIRKKHKIRCDLNFHIWHFSISFMTFSHFCTDFNSGLIFIPSFSHFQTHLHIYFVKWKKEEKRICIG